MHLKMFMPIFRYKSESNSQQMANGIKAKLGCLCQSLDTRMKAINEVKERCRKVTTNN